MPISARVEGPCVDRILSGGSSCFQDGSFSLAMPSPAFAEDDSFDKQGLRRGQTPEGLDGHDVRTCSCSVPSGKPRHPPLSQLHFTCSL
jgi:hypothetical protein